MFGKAMTFLNRESIILSQVKKDKNIVYGAQSIKKQIGFLARPTFDYDIFASVPKTSANKLERTLDKKSGGDYYYVKPAEHPGTFKVRSVGFDDKKGTADDFTIADFTRPNKKVGYVIINGIRYSKLSESIKDKHKSLSDKQYAFRHEKDRDDLNRILAHKRLRWR